VKIVGYDDIQENIKFPRRLTTIGSDKKQMAEVAAEVLIHKIERGGGRLFQKVHEVYVVEGETT
jgi:DNA-binding LacI/PurR family transcriptional regulator